MPKTEGHFLADIAGFMFNTEVDFLADGRGFAETEVRFLV